MTDHSPKAGVERMLFVAHDAAIPAAEVHVLCGYSFGSHLPGPRGMQYRCPVYLPPTSAATKAWGERWVLHRWKESGWHVKDAPSCSDNHTDQGETVEVVPAAALEAQREITLEFQRQAAEIGTRLNAATAALSACEEKLKAAERVEDGLREISNQLIDDKRESERRLAEAVGLLKEPNAWAIPGDWFKRKDAFLARLDASRDGGKNG